MIFRSMTLGAFLLLCACNAETFEYDREAFGPTWSDVDHNGCDTRNDILQRDLDGVETRDRCKVTDGVLKDPYDNTLVTFGPNTIHIDHVVSLKDAWESGANSWPMIRRIQFANDPDNLVATSKANNLSKGAKAPDQWVPKADLCKYINHYVGVKAKYDLKITISIPERCT
jgi:hypothetical protein